VNQIDNPERLNAIQRVGRQFTMVPWWMKPILALGYAAAFIALVFVVRWVAAAGISDNPDAAA